MGRVIRPDRKSDGGFTLVEVVLAIAILSVGIAAAAAGLSLAASARSDNDGRSLAVEIANEALQRAEAFGCGLPIDYNGVSAADRLAACDYNGTQTRGAALADVDYTIEHEGRSFDVEIRMRWHSIRPDITSGYFPSAQECERRKRWNNNETDTTLSSGNPTKRSDPTLLSRQVTVIAPDDTSVTLESTEAVSSVLAGSNVAFLYVRTYNNSRVYIVLDGLTDKYELHTDTNACAVFVHLEGSKSYSISYDDNNGNLVGPKTGTTCVTTGTPPECSTYSSRP